MLRAGGPKEYSCTLCSPAKSLVSERTEEQRDSWVCCLTCGLLAPWGRRAKPVVVSARPRSWRLEPRGVSRLLVVNWDLRGPPVGAVPHLLLLVSAAALGLASPCAAPGVVR